MGRSIEDIRKQIVDFANSDKEFGWFKVHYAGKNYKFPKRALINFVFGASPALEDKIPKYNPFSYSGIKLPLDNPYHTDSWLGAGFDIDEVYNHDCVEYKAWIEANIKIEQEMQEIVKFDFVILANGRKDDKSTFSFMIYEYDPPLPKGSWSNIHVDSDSERDEIKAICIPHAGVEYERACRNADVIITETGGKLAHMAIISREQGKLLIRCDDACSKFRKFTKLRLDLNNMTLKANYNY